MPRPALTPEKILDTASALIDAEGLEAFSFRKLGSALSCQAMSLYHHFASKQALFEALLNRFLSHAADFPDAGPWPGRLRQAAQAWREAALAHPGFYPHVARFRLNHAPGLALLERQAAIFRDAGLVPRARARHFRAFHFYLNGACLEETAGRHAPAALAPLPFAEAAAAFPGLMELAPHLLPERAPATFQHGLDLLIRAIEAEVRPLARSGR